jgi:hypothetical protein
MTARMNYYNKNMPGTFDRQQAEQRLKAGQRQGAMSVYAVSVTIRCAFPAPCQAPTWRKHNIEDRAC